jgi:hypothetical protein
MDPQSTLYDLLDCCFRNDRQGFDQALTDLRNWNRCGGFLPSVDRPGSQSVAHYVVRRKITEAGPLPEDLGSALGEDEFTPHYIHEAVETWCEEDGCLTARESWEREPALRTEVRPGDHVLLPADWLDDDSAFEGELSEVAVVQREFQPDVADGDLRYFVVTPLFDDYRETKLSENCLHWGRLQWLAENAAMGSGTHGAETFREGGGSGTASSEEGTGGWPSLT